MNNDKLKLITNQKNEKYTKGDNFIKFCKFLAGTSLLLITNENDVDVYENIYSQEKLLPNFTYKESNFIYDFDTLLNDNYPPLIFISSKDNPIRILDNQCRIKGTFLLKKQSEEILTPNFISLEPFGLNLFCGKNFLKKIDLVTEKIVDINQKKFKGYLLSSFDFHFKNSFYLLGSYTKDIFFCDYRSNKIENEKKEAHAVNQIKFLNKDPNYYFVGYRNSDSISLYDIRMNDVIVSNFFRNCLSTQKINFTLDKQENFLFTGGIDGGLLVYDINELKAVCYFDVNFDNNDGKEGISCVDVLEDKLLVSLGKRKFEEFDVENEEVAKVTDNNNSSFQLWKID